MVAASCLHPRIAGYCSRSIACSSCSCTASPLSQDPPQTSVRVMYNSINSKKKQPRGSSRNYTRGKMGVTIIVLELKTHRLPIGRYKGRQYLTRQGLFPIFVLNVTDEQ